MTASSVTGIGIGNGATPASTPVLTTAPKILAAGQVTTDGGGGRTVTFPTPLPAPFAIFTTAFFATSGEARVGWATDSNGDLANITVVGDASSGYFYMVVSAGVVVQR